MASLADTRNPRWRWWDRLFCLIAGGYWAWGWGRWFIDRFIDSFHITYLVSVVFLASVAFGWSVIGTLLHYRWPIRIFSLLQFGHITLWFIILPWWATGGPPFAAVAASFPRPDLSDAASLMPYALVAQSVLVPVMLFRPAWLLPAKPLPGMIRKWWQSR